MFFQKFGLESDFFSKLFGRTVDCVLQVGLGWFQSQMPSSNVSNRFPIQTIIAVTLLLCMHCSAQTPQIARVDVTEFGVYSMDRKEAGSNSVDGVPQRTVMNVRLVQQTRIVPLRKGVHFGFRYSIVGSPDAAPVQLRMVTLYPPGGLHNPAAHTPIQRSEFAVTRKIGTGYSSYHGVALDFDWALVPGDWTLEIWSGDRRLTSEVFTLVK